MSISKRQEQILRILNERTYISVNDLSKLTFTSSSSIRRDLTYLQDNGLVKRLHGGVSAVEPITHVASFYDRTKKNVKKKRTIAKKASSFLKDGQTILLDSSTTSTFLLPFIAKHRNITVFTNNLSTAINSIELGIDTHCLGGHAVRGGFVLYGDETFNSLQNISVDILFFSSQTVNNNGDIYDSTEEENYIRKIMLNCAKTSVFLCDSEKFNSSSTYKLCNLSNIDFAVFDQQYNELETNCTIL